jgi:hypothetical protein
VATGHTSVANTLTVLLGAGGGLVGLVAGLWLDKLLPFTRVRVALPPNLRPPNPAPVPPFTSTPCVALVALWSAGAISSARGTPRFRTSCGCSLP